MFILEEPPPKELRKTTAEVVVPSWFWVWLVLGGVWGWFGIGLGLGLGLVWAWFVGSARELHLVALLRVEDLRGKGLFSAGNFPTKKTLNKPYRKPFKKTIPPNIENHAKNRQKTTKQLVLKQT